MLSLSPHLSSLHPAVELLADIVQNCSLEDSQIEKERDVILQELQENDTSMRDMVFNYLHATAFQGTPLAQSVEGPSENVRCELAGPGGRSSPYWGLGRPQLQKFAFSWPSASAVYFPNSHNWRHFLCSHVFPRSLLECLCGPHSNCGLCFHVCVLPA